MKIYHLVSNKEWGGGEQTVLDLSRRQLADGIAIELFCLPSDAIKEKFLELNVPIHTLPLHGALDFVSAWKMSKILKHSDASAINAHNFKEAFTAAYARCLSGRKDIRLVMCRNLTRVGKTSKLYQWLYNQIDSIVFDSQLAMDVFMSSRPRINRDKMRVIFNAVVVPDKIEKADLRGEFNIPDSEAVVMYHGRLNPEKGLDVLIEAVALVSDKPFRLVLVGRGSDEYTRQLKSLVAARGLTDKVFFAGFRNPVLAYVAACDIGVLPSIVREGCSLAAQEHMSQGHPIIATNNGGQREYIRDGKNGLLVPPDDAENLALAIAKLVDDIQLRRQMGIEAKADYDRYLNYDHFYEQIKTIYTPSIPSNKTLET